MCLGNRLEDFPEKAYSSRQLPFKRLFQSQTKDQNQSLYGLTKYFRFHRFLLKLSDFFFLV